MQRFTMFHIFSAAKDSKSRRAWEYYRMQNGQVLSFESLPTELSCKTFFSISCPSPPPQKSTLNSSWLRSHWYEWINHGQQYPLGCNIPKFSLLYDPKSETFELQSTSLASKQLTFLNFSYFLPHHLVIFFSKGGLIPSPRNLRVFFP